MVWIRFVLFFLPIMHSVAQVLPYTEPRSESRGNTFILEQGLGSLLVNPSGNAGLKSFSILITGQNIGGSEGVSTAALGFALPVKIGSLGFIVWNTGDQNLSQSRISANWAQKLGIAQLGITTSLGQTRITGTSSIYTFLLDFSGIVTLSPQLNVGAGISNITKAKYSEEDPIPVIGRFGIEIIPVQAFHMAIEIEKDLIRNPVYKFGFSYLIKERFELLTGFNIQPLLQTVGFALHLKKFTAQWAYSNLPGLGSKLSFSITCQPKRNRNA